MAKLRFDKKAVQKLIDHSEGSSEHKPSFGQEDEVPAGLWLVKDNGIYLMSNGSDPWPNGKSVIAYAQGYEPDADDSWDRCRDAVGGDDFCEFLGMDFVTLGKVYGLGGKTFNLIVSETEITVG